MIFSPSTNGLQSSQNRNKGLTLVEILLVIALLGLIAFLVVQTLIPSPDRLCKLEAERLVAFISAASNEAKMREGAVRVKFTLTPQQAGTAQHEYAELLVETTTVSWVEAKNVNRIVVIRHG